MASLGPVYGAQWRDWQTPDGRHIDQMKLLLDDLRHQTSFPSSYRDRLESGSVCRMSRAARQDNARAGLQALPPCHMMFQFHVAGGRLSCQMYQRSADVFLGVPFNIASYALY